MKAICTHRIGRETGGTAKAWVLLLGLASTAYLPPGRAAAVEISSLKELAHYAAQSGHTVTMKPGQYRLIEFIPLDTIRSRRERNEFQFITFSGSNNVFRLDGVSIEVDTALRAALRPSVHNSEFVVSGDNNALQGLAITNIGNGTSPGGAMLSITGKGTTLRDCTFLVRGSFPYGYGDLFGKGGGSVISHHKQSGIHIAGDNTRLVGCKLYMRAFGHGYFIQNNAGNVHLEDCSVEGEMRSTDDMLAETSGPAFDAGFRTVMRNRQGEHRVLPGYMKSLAEDGFRTYGEHKNLTFKNCTAKNMRGGFELRTQTGVRLENCTAVGNERAFWVSTGATLINCRGDAQYGPLLFVEGENASADLALVPSESTNIVHALATIHGSGHSITVHPWRDENRTQPLPIMVGYSQPGAGEGMSPIGEKPARTVKLQNATAMPVIIGRQASNCEIATRGPVAENAGQAISILDQDL